MVLNMCLTNGFSGKILDIFSKKEADIE